MHELLHHLLPGQGRSAEFRQSETADRRYPALTISYGWPREPAGRGSLVSTTTHPQVGLTVVNSSY